MTPKNIVYISLSLLLVPTYLFSGDNPDASTAQPASLQSVTSSTSSAQAKKAPAKKGSAKVLPATPTSSTSSLPAVAAVASGKTGGSVREEVITTGKTTAADKVADQSFFGKAWDWTWGHDANVIAEKEKGTFNTSAAVVSDSRQNHAVQQLIDKRDQAGLQKLVDASAHIPLTETGYQSTFEFLHEQQEAELTAYVALIKEHSASLAARKKLISKVQGQHNSLMLTKVGDQNAKIAPLKADDTGYESDNELYKNPSHCFEKAKNRIVEPTEHKDEDTTSV